MNSFSRTVVPSKIWLSMALMAVALAGGCNSATVTNAWRDPSFTGTIQFKKTVVLVIHPDGAVRRVAEDQMVKIIGPERAVAGYTFLSDDDLKDINTVKAKIRAIGADGAITLKPLGSRSQTTYVPGNTGYGGFYNDYDRAGGFMGDPGMVVTDTITSVQTNIYTVADGKLIWSGTCELYDVTSASKAVDEIAKAVGAQLKKEKLL